MPGHEGAGHEVDGVYKRAGRSWGSQLPTGQRKLDTQEVSISAVGMNSVKVLREVEVN